MNPITIFRGTTGLNTVDDPARIPIQENGMADVAEIVNMIIDRSGRPMTRPGLSSLQAGSFHSLFCDGGDCFVIKDDSLYRVAVDGALQGIRSGLTAGRRTTYAQHGEHTYYSNGIERGRIKGGISYAWNKGTYRGVDTARAFSGPISGDHMDIFSGRMFVSTGDTLYWSNLFDFDLYCKDRDYVRFHTDILFVRAVNAGLYVSTKNKVYFLTPNEIGSFSPMVVTPYPGVEWSDTLSDISPSELGFDGAGQVAAWASREGVVLGLSTGLAININKNKIIYPENATSGLGAFMGYHFIHGVN